jgi:4-amino-4-deoxy-L-arabinose transferase-like glycosyltransferase
MESTVINTFNVERVRPTHSLRSDAALLAGIASIVLIVHFALGNGYGFHRDELQFLDDARHLQWGFAAYPPMTAFSGRIAIALFGISPQVFRLPAALVNAVWLVLAGLTARELGGRRSAQILTVLTALPVALVFSSVLQYNTFDLLAWSTLIYFTARVLSTGDERFWLGAGVGVGIGVLSKYTIAFPTASLLAAILLLPSQRHHLRSRGFWWGVLTAAALAAPNLVWLASHHFLTLQMEHHIHIRDVRNGRAAGYYTDQLRFTLFALPMAIAGLVSLMRSARFRLLSAFYIGPFVLLALAKGRGYYLMPAYPVLYAAGAVALERLILQRAVWLRLCLRSLVVAAALLDTAAVAWAYLPIWPVGSPGWNWQMKNNADMANEVGWPEFVAQVAAVRDTLSPGDRSRLAILANNFGEAGALELWGPQYHLPTPISSVNSFHDRGYGPYEPETVIVVGGELYDQLGNFETCSIVALVRLPYGVRTEETDDHPEILVCHHLRRPWPEVWRRSQAFG